MGPLLGPFRKFPLSEDQVNLLPKLPVSPRIAWVSQSLSLPRPYSTTPFLERANWCSGRISPVYTCLPPHIAVRVSPLGFSVWCLRFPIVPIETTVLCYPCGAKQSTHRLDPLLVRGFRAKLPDTLLQRDHNAKLHKAHPDRNRSGQANTGCKSGGNTKVVERGRGDIQHVPLPALTQGNPWFTLFSYNSPKPSSRTLLASPKAVDESRGFGATFCAWRQPKRLHNLGFYIL